MICYNYKCGSHVKYVLEKKMILPVKQEWRPWRLEKEGDLSKLIRLVNMADWELKLGFSTPHCHHPSCLRPASSGNHSCFQTQLCFRAQVQPYLFEFTKLIPRDFKRWWQLLFACLGGACSVRTIPPSLPRDHLTSLLLRSLQKFSTVQPAHSLGENELMNWPGPVWNWGPVWVRGPQVTISKNMFSHLPFAIAF